MGCATSDEQPADDLLFDRNSDGLQETCDTVAVAVELSDSCKMSLPSFDILFGTELDKFNRCLKEKSIFWSLNAIVVRITFTVRSSVDILAMTRDMPEIDGHS